MIGRKLEWYSSQSNEIITSLIYVNNPLCFSFLQDEHQEHYLTMTWLSKYDHTTSVIQQYKKKKERKDLNYGQYLTFDTL